MNRSSQPERVVVIATTVLFFFFFVQKDPLFQHPLGTRTPATKPQCVLEQTWLISCILSRMYTT